jgi:hypothetical protein
VLIAIAFAGIAPGSTTASRPDSSPNSDAQQRRLPHFSFVTITIVATATLPRQAPGGSW